MLLAPTALCPGDPTSAPPPASMSLLARLGVGGGVDIGLTRQVLARQVLASSRARVGFDKVSTPHLPPPPPPFPPCMCGGGRGVRFVCVGGGARGCVCVTANLGLVVHASLWTLPTLVARCKLACDGWFWPSINTPSAAPFPSSHVHGVVEGCGLACQPQALCASGCTLSPLGARC
jgi:hypothetical protein